MIYPVKITDLKTTTFGKEKYILLPAKYSHKIITSLASMINEAVEAGEIKKPNVVVAIAKGSLTWAKTLADWLNISNLQVIQLLHYQDVGERMDRPVILKGLNEPVINKNVLIFDNVADSGLTLEMAVEYLKMASKGEITTATLFYKPRSCFKPTFFAFKTSYWIVFHHDVLETVKQLSTKWLQDGLSKTEIRERFIKIGIPREEVKYALSIVFKEE